MNNSNGTALLARIKSGDLVTVRRVDGSRVTGRAYESPTGLYLRTADRFIYAVTVGNIISIDPRQ